MPRPALATLDYLEARLGYEVTDPAQAQARLEDASAIVRAYASKTWLDVDGHLIADVPEDIAGVVAGMVERIIRNPDGAVAETAGPFQRQLGPRAAERLYLSAMDKLVIDAAVASPGLTTISTTRGLVETHTVRDWFWFEPDVFDPFW